MATDNGQEKTDTLEEVNVKLVQLTDGIAKYRETAQNAEKTASEAKAEAAAAKAEAAAAKKEADELRKPKDDDKTIKLSEADEKRLAAWAK